MDRGKFILSLLSKQPAVNVQQDSSRKASFKIISNNDESNNEIGQVKEISSVQGNQISVKHLNEGHAVTKQLQRYVVPVQKLPLLPAVAATVVCEQISQSLNSQEELGVTASLETNETDCDEFQPNNVIEEVPGPSTSTEVEVEEEEVSPPSLYDSDDSVKDRNYEYTSDNNNSTSGSESSLRDVHQKDMTKGRPKKGRKRKFADQDRTIRKKKYNSNETHYTVKGKPKLAKEFRKFQCICSNKCNTKISEEEGKHFFDNYWKLGEYNAQTTFLSSFVTEKPVKRKLTGTLNPNRRNFSRTYSINKVTVCRDMFINTLNISSKRINTSIKKVRNLEIKDKRGVAGGHNKMTPDQKESVINHINKFPRYVSHYCRSKKSEQEYLPIGVTLPLMYKLYKEEYQNCVSFSAYRKLFLTEFNLKTKVPKKDTCNKCDAFQSKIDSSMDNDQKDLLTSEHRLHLEEADCARKKMEIDIKNASVLQNLETLTFDMQKTLPLPRLSTNIIFYKRQLWLYNCGVYGAKRNRSVFNIWIEGQAGRGSQEVGSCIRKYIKNYIDKDVTKIILWSDSCGGQNRNIKIVLMLKCILEENDALESIEICFLVSGHSFLRNDSDFGDVECALKKQQKLFTPQDYVNVMQDCRRKNPITVNFMLKEDFVGTSVIERQIINRKKDNNNEKINWFHIKEIKIIKEKPYSIFIKNSHNSDETYKEINIKKKQGRPSSTAGNVANFSSNLLTLWPNGKPVAEPKLKDIKSYMHLIPEIDQGFYKNLTGDPIVQEDIDGYNGELDFEPEED